MKGVALQHIIILTTTLSPSMNNKKLPGLPISKLGHTDLIYLEETAQCSAWHVFEFSLNQAFWISLFDKIIPFWWNWTKDLVTSKSTTLSISSHNFGESCFALKNH